MDLGVANILNCHDYWLKQTAHHEFYTSKTCIFSEWLILTFLRKWETNDTNCSGGKHSCNRPHAHKLSLIKLKLLPYFGLELDCSSQFIFYTVMNTFHCTFKCCTRNCLLPNFPVCQPSSKFSWRKKSLYQSFLMLQAADCTAVRFVLIF